ncbi:MAG: hypothetical protein ABJA82_09920 [Myxococcales bacterium]
MARAFTFVVCYEDLVAHEDALVAGKHFLPNPFGPTDVARKVRNILDAREAEPGVRERFSQFVRFLGRL